MRVHVCVGINLLACLMAHLQVFIRSLCQCAHAKKTLPRQLPSSVVLLQPALRTSSNQDLDTRSYAGSRRGVSTSFISATERTSSGPKAATAQVKHWSSSLPNTTNSAPFAVSRMLTTSVNNCRHRSKRSDVQAGMSCGGTSRRILSTASNSEAMTGNA